MEALNYWKLILEIAILWYVIYLILLFVKGTRSEQLLKGLLIICLIFVITQQLHLTAITWVLTRLLPISVIALVIVFQPELRRGLAQLGKFGIHEENVGAVDEISQAVVTLAVKKIGALIVIERHVGLKSYIESGIPVDAKVTSSIIAAIFMPQSPLHDGAAIIQHGRIAAAGCVLPLPEDEARLPKSLGMRHRAAIGVTEETDALCIVVSEQTGAFSIAENGRLTHGLNEETLIKNLKEMLYNPISKKIPFRIKSRLMRVSRIKS